MDRLPRGSYQDYPDDRRLLNRELTKIMRGRWKNVRKVEAFLRKYVEKGGEG